MSYQIAPRRLTRDDQVIFCRFLDSTVSLWKWLEQNWHKPIFSCCLVTSYIMIWLFPFNPCPDGKVWLEVWFGGMIRGYDSGYDSRVWFAAPKTFISSTGRELSLEPQLYRPSATNWTNLTLATLGRSACIGYGPGTVRVWFGYDSGMIRVWFVVVVVVVVVRILV